MCRLLDSGELLCCKPIPEGQQPIKILLDLLENKSNKMEIGSCCIIT